MSKPNNDVVYNEEHQMREDFRRNDDFTNHYFPSQENLDTRRSDDEEDELE